MRNESLVGRKRRKFKNTTDSNHSHATAPNLLDRKFHREQPDQVWVGDITYVSTHEGWLYLAVLIDLCTHKVVGWSMSDHIDTTLALGALDMAIATRKPKTGLIHHTDRGVQYACGDYQRSLSLSGLTPSMSRKGNCWDNACSETLFGSLKVERLHGQRFETIREAKDETIAWLLWYNRTRMHSTLNYVSPMQFEQNWIDAKAKIAA
jgi:transposase InsO family protein